MKSQFSALLVSIFIISACGGGGGGGDSAPTTPAPQNITVSLTSSADSAEVNSPITLTWSSTLASSCSASGAWSGSKGTSGSESITVGVGGSNTFTLSCSATGANSGSASTTVNGLRYFDGKVFDGYIRGAEVFVDTNNNSTLDSDETSVTTDNQGNFTKLLYADGLVISKGGIDSDTGADLSSLTLAHKMVGFEATKIISPITSLAAYMTKPEDINAALGINASIDLMSVDPIPNLGQSEYDFIYEKGNQLTVIAYSLQNSLNAINQTTETSQDYFVSIAEEIEKSYAASPGLVDIESNTFIEAVVENIIAKKASSIDVTDKTNMTSAISSVIPLIQVKSDAATTTAIQNFAFRTMQTDIKSLATGDASTGTVDNYSKDILTYISTDQNISSTDLEIDISALSDSTSLDEDSSIEISPLTNDSYLRGQAVQLSIATSPTNGSASVANEVITYTPDADWNGSESFTYSIVQGSKSATGTIEVTVAPINDAPIINSSSSISTNEAISSVTTIAATDVDEDSLTFSLSGADADLFSIGVSGDLTFNSVPDFENPADAGEDNIYNITVSVSDGIESVELAMVITVVNTAEESNPPIFTLISYEPTSIDVTTENKSVVVKLQVTDESDVVLSPWNAQLQLTGAPDIPDNVFEEGAPNSWVLESGNARNGIYSATIEVPAGSIAGLYSIDGGFWEDIHGNTANYWSKFDNNQVVSIINSPASVNTAPTISLVSTYLILENETSVLTVSATDADGDELTYSIGGDDASLLSISSAGTITFNAAPDFENPTDSNSDNVYSIVVTVSDGTDSVNGNLSIEVQDVVEAGGTLGPYKLYGGTNSDVYLGCYGTGCSDVSSESICNSVGIYGSTVSTTSIWNSVSAYGSNVSNDSPWNSFASNPPEIKQSNGSSTVSFGKFSVNQFVPERTILSLFNNITDKYTATNSLTETRAFACPNS